MNGQYCVLTIMNEVLKSSRKEFVSPSEKISDAMERCTDNDTVTNIEYGDYEFYLNRKLDFAVEEYIKTYNDIRATLKSMLNRTLSMKTGIDTLTCSMTTIEVLERKVERLINRMINEDFDIENEQAHILYDLMKKQGRTI